MSKYEIDMCNGPIMTKLVSYFIPLMVSGVLQLLFNAVDLVVVGRFTGSEALAAVGATTSLITLFTNLFIGISLGTSVMVARYYATGDSKKVSEAVHTAMLTAIVSGVAMIFAGLLFSKGALALMDTPDNVIEQSALYMRIYFVGMPFFMVYNYGAAILRAVGDTKRPLIFLVIAGSINAVLNMFLVIVFHMGVAGVAIATVVSQLISCILVVRCLILSDTSYGFIPSRLISYFNIHILRKILSIGIPSGIQGTVINFSNVLLQSSVNSFGSTAMAGYTAAFNILGFLFVSVNSISQACMSFTSQNYGARKYDRVDRVLVDCVILDVIVGLCLGGFVYIFGEKIIGIYTTSEAAVAYGMEVLAITVLPYFLCGIMDCIPGSLRGLSYALVPMVLSVIGTVGVRLVWIFGLFPSHRSLSFLFISYPASWILTIIMQVICFAFVRRRLETR